MKNLFKIFIILSLFITTFESCSNDEEEIDILDIPLTRGESNALDASNSLAFKLIKAIRTENKEREVIGSDANFFMSPQSFAWTLSMMANGFDDSLKNNIIEVLGFDSKDQFLDFNECSKKIIEGVTSPNYGSVVEVNNLLGYRNFEINNDYVSTLKDFYKAEILKDFNEDKVAKWINDKTNNRFTNLHLNFGNLSLIHVNTISFNGLWSEKFGLKDTENNIFHNEDGSESEIEFMHSKREVTVSTNEYCNCLSLYFWAGNYRIFFIIPTENNTIDSVVQKLDNDSWKNLLENYTSMFLDIKIPKIDMHSEINFTQIFDKIGINDNLLDSKIYPKISSTQPLSYGFLSQSSNFSMDEEGVIAVSVGTPGKNELFIPQSSLFYIDEPFLFFITERSTGAVLFAGHVNHL